MGCWQVFLTAAAKALSLSLYGGAEVAFSESLGSLAAVLFHCRNGAKSAEGQFSALNLELALLGKLIPAV